MHNVSAGNKGFLSGTGQDDPTVFIPGGFEPVEEGFEVIDYLLR